MSAIEDFKKRFESRPQWATVPLTQADLYAALAEAWEMGKQDTLTFVMYSNADEYSNPFEEES